jgi:uncharacterized membrane protein YqiK
LPSTARRGLQAATLTPGLHFLLFPWQYAVRFDDLTVIQPGRLGKVTLIDGEPISPGRVLGQHVDCNFFQDLSTFLRNHGQRGPQSTILPPGTYRLNTRAVFVNAEFDASRSSADGQLRAQLDHRLR